MSYIQWWNINPSEHLEQTDCKLLKLTSSSLSQTVIVTHCLIEQKIKK